MGNYKIILSTNYTDFTKKEVETNLHSTADRINNKIMRITQIIYVNKQQLSASFKELMMKNQKKEFAKYFSLHIEIVNILYNKKSIK